MKLKVEYVPIGTVKEYENNAKLHPAEQIQQIKESIRQFGNCDPIGVWHDPEKGDVIVEGHGRLQALTEMGETEIPIIRLDHLTDEQRKAYALVHNKLTMNSDFDTDTLLSELDDILDIDMSEFGFDLSLNEDDATEVSDDEYEEPDDIESKVKPGQVWTLGNHTLICGDSTDGSIITKLLRGGVADISITSPPYGESDSAKLRDHYVRGNEKRRSLYKTHEDNADEWSDLIRGSFKNMKDHSKAQFINIQMLAANKRNLIGFISENVDALVDIIVWDKKKAPPQMQKNILNNQYEFVFVFSNDNGSRTIPFADFHGNVSNIIELTTGKNEFAEIHRAVYPVEFPAAIINIASECNSVLDVFGGTGTTMIACEQLNRICYMCEIDPHYCDVIIDRWEKFTGKEAVLVA